MNGRTVMRAAAVVAGIVLSRATDFDAADAVLLAGVAAAFGLGLWINQMEAAA